MSNAQGHITVRRRPKDGDNGADAIDYKFIPSAYSIVLQKDGSLRPSALSARLVKKVGGSPEVDMISSSFEGHTVLCHIRKSGGNNTSGYTPGTSLTLSSSSSSTLLSVDFELVYSGKVVASITIPCIPAGIDGEDSYVLDLDNEMQGIPCTSAGVPTGSGTLAETTATVYKGSKVDTGWEFSISTDSSGCTASIDKTTGKVTVTAISADKASVIVVATKGSLTREAVMSLYKVKPGTNGTSPVVYSILATSAAVSLRADGSLDPASFGVAKQKTVGDVTENTTEKILRYERVGYDTQVMTLGANGGVINVGSASTTKINIWLYDDDGSTVLDSETIPVVKDGADGKPGEDAYVLDLDNEMQGIPCDSSGTPTGSGTLATSQATVYKGSKVDTGWEFSISTDSSGCRASIGKTTGKVTVTAISADKASVIVVAKNGSLTREAVMSLYKVKPGTNGTSPVVYSILTTSAAVSLRADGNLDPASFGVAKQKTVGDVTENTTEKILRYERVGYDTQVMTLGANGGVINVGSASTTKINIWLYDDDGSTVLDSETIPVVRDGDKGDSAVSYWLVPSVTQVSKSASGTLIPNSVSCQVMRQVGEEPAEIASDLFVLYKIMQTNGVTGSGVRYTPGSALNVVATTKQIVFELYKTGSVTAGIASGTGVALHTATIVVVDDGQQGLPGIVRAPLRAREWDKLPVNTEFYSGEKDGDEWTDVVYKFDTSVEAGVKYWRVKKYFNKTSGQTLPSAEDQYLVATSNMGSLATDIFLAHYALIKNLGVETIDMRDSSGNILFQAKDGVVTCNTGNFKNVNVSGALQANTLDLKVSTQNHNGDASPVPNGSICVNASSMCLPELAAGVVRTIRILNPLETRAAPNDLVLSRATTNVRISSTLSWMDAKASAITLEGKGFNGNVLIELLGYRKADSSLTYWLTQEVSI